MQSSRVRALSQQLPVTSQTLICVATSRSSMHRCLAIHAMKPTGSQGSFHGLWSYETFSDLECLRIVVSTSMICMQKQRCLPIRPMHSLNSRLASHSKTGVFDCSARSFRPFALVMCEHTCNFASLHPTSVALCKQ
jgi:hypothetical protein